MKEEFRYMMQAEHCYLRRDVKDDVDSEIPMLIYNQPQGMLVCKEQRRNGEGYLLFDITSLKTMSDLFAHHKFTESDIRLLLEEVVHVMRECDRYMLSYSKIILDPDLIFYDQNKSEYVFLYDPFSEIQGNENLYRLTEYVVEYADYESVNAFELANRFFDAVRNSNFTVRTLLECLEYQGCDLEEEEEPNIDSQVAQEEDGEEYIKPTFTKVMIYFGIVVMAAAGMIALIFRLTWKEKMLVTLAAIVGVTLVLISLIGKYKKRKQIARQNPIDDENQLYDEKTVLITPDNYLELRGLAGMGAENNRWLPLPPSEMPCTIGKKEGYVDITLEDSTVSRVHARFSKEDGKIVLTDLHSTNGTYINGVRIEPDQKFALRIGDQIGFGKMNFTYC